MRKLKLLLAAVALTLGGVISANAAKTVYLSPGVWATDDARFALYMFTDGVGSAWVDVTDEDGDGIFTATCDDSYEKMIFCRMDKTNTTNAWNDDGGTVWNQTQDIVIPAIDNLSYVITGWDNDNGKSGYNMAAYIYNKDADLFFTRGNDWGTQAVAAPVGLPWKLEQNDGKYTLKMYDIYTQNSNDTGLGYAGAYTDSGDPLAFTPEGDAATGYTLKNGDKYINCPATAGVVEFNTTASNWVFLSQPQYNEALASRAKAQEAQIATLKGITVPDGSSLSEVVGDADNWAFTLVDDGVPTSANWTATKHNDRGGNNNWGDYGSEMYQCGAAHYTRTITGLKQGVYKVSVRAMKRVGTNDNGYAMGQAGFSVSDSYVNANGYIIPIKAWSDDCVSNSSPNSPADFVSIVNNGGYTTEGFVYVGSDGNLSLDVASEAFWWGSWFLFNGISYTYYDNSVSDEDATAILAQATTLEEKAMLATLKSALTIAKNNFDGDRTIANYNALQTAINNANPSATAYAAAKSAIDAAKDIQANTNVVTAAAATTFAEAIAAIETPYNERTLTNDVANAAGTTLGVVVTNWRANPNGAAGKYMESAWDNAADFGDYYINTWSNEGANDGSNFVVPFFEYWTDDAKSLGAKTMTATQEGLVPNGIYTVSVWARARQANSKTKVAGSITLQVGEGGTTDMTTGTQVGSSQFYLDTFTATGQADADGKLTIKINVAAESNISWLSFKSVKYTEVESASSEDYAALAAALEDVKDNTFGFEAGEYAPYNNVAAVKALAAAKAIDATVVNAKADVTAATAALTAVTWTNNTEEVNAFYDGDFSEPAIQETSADGTKLPGWTSGNNIRQILGTVQTFPGLADASANKAIFAWSGGATYGQENGYTMPLKANTSYVLKFKAAGWNNETRSGMTVSVLNGEDGLAATDLGAPDRDIKGNETNTAGMTSFEKVFTTGAAGNYIFSIRSGNNIVMTDFDLRVLNPVYAVVGSNQEETDKAIFSGIWDAATTTDLLVENEGVWTKTYTDQELDAQTIVYKVIMKTSEESTKAAEWYPSGDNLTISIPVKGKYDITFTFTEGETPTVTGVATKTAEAVAIGEKLWATTVTNSPLNFAGQTVEAYTATVADNTVSLTKVDNVQAETGLVLKGSAGTYYIPVAESSETDKGDLKFSSIYNYEITDDELSSYTFYGLTVNEESNEAQFVKLKKGTIQPQKAFLKVEGSGLARTLNVVFAGDETTGINGVATVNGAETIYNINGQRVAAPAKGLYIVNGKKVVMK